MVAVNSVKTFVMGIFKGGKPKQLVKPITEVGTKTAPVEKLKTVVDQPGLRILEQVRGDKLFRYETRVINGKPTSSMQVFSGKGESIGINDSGLYIDRTKSVTVEDCGSIFGGKKITIDKNYRDTMAQTARQEKVVKEYTPEGIYEHGESYLKYRHWEKPKITEYDRITFANGQTPYSEALEAKKVAEAARQAEEKALAAARLKAEQELAAKVAAETPRVNIGKVFGKNFDELKKIQDKTLADGTITRTYRTKDRNGFSQYIITKDKDSCHQECIIDTAKKMKIIYTQHGNAKPEITMSKGLQYRQTSKMVKFSDDSYNYREEKLFYNNGRDCVELDEYGNIGRFNVNGIPGYESVPDAFAGISSMPYTPVNKEAVTMLKEIQKEAKSEYVNLLDLFKPFVP